MAGVTAVQDDHKIRTKKLKSISFSPDMSRIAVVILGGGEGKRLFPLTLNRCKPAICFGGRYKLIDVPISNSIHSGCHKIFVITQFLSASLHQHLFKTYRQEVFHRGFLEVLSPEQRPYRGGWFNGTADAVRQNIEYLMEISADYFLILSGDQIYSMDYTDMLRTAIETDADLVIAALPVEEHKCKEMGILKINADNYITDFVEKPTDKSILERLRSLAKNGSNKPKQDYLGSMGIYLFKRETLFHLLNEDSREDFGKHLIPTMISKGTVAAHIYDGYWEDVGTIETYHAANIALTSLEPHFDCHDPFRPLYSMSHCLPGPKISRTLINDSIICEGCIIDADEISKSILGPRTRVKKGSIINNSYVMGNDHYTPPHGTKHLPDDLHIGEDCIIRNAILDKNVCVGDHVRLINKKRLSHYDSENVYIRDGIIIVPAGATIPDRFIL